MIPLAQQIKITKKTIKKGDDGHKVVSVRMRDELIAQLDVLAAQTNRSRNELINILLKAAIDIVEVEDA